MESSAYAIGQAVFLRSDTPDYEERIIPFTSLEEMVRICSRPERDMILDKVILYAMPDGKPVALTLGFIAATEGQVPDSSLIDESNRG